MSIEEKFSKLTERNKAIVIAEIKRLLKEERNDE